MNANAMSLNNSSSAAYKDDIADEEKTSDIFGKHLRQLKLLDGAPPNSPPLIFWLLAGYFRKNPHYYKTEGVFRVAAPEAQVRELELHMS